MGANLNEMRIRVVGLDGAVHGLVEVLAKKHGTSVPEMMASVILDGLRANQESLASILA